MKERINKHLEAVVTKGIEISINGESPLVL